MSVDIEDTDQLLNYLRANQRIGSQEKPIARRLKGGVSNKAVLLLRLEGSAWVLKQALNAANALLLKVNQIGTLTEAKEAYRLAREGAWRISISARSGETEDNWLADLAVGWSGDFIKIGSITQSERLAKYNRLLKIEGDWLRKPQRMTKKR